MTTLSSEIRAVLDKHGLTGLAERQQEGLQFQLDAAAYNNPNLNLAELLDAAISGLEARGRNRAQIFSIAFNPQHRLLAEYLERNPAASPASSAEVPVWRSDPCKFVNNGAGCQHYGSCPRRPEIDYSMSAYKAGVFKCIRTGSSANKTYDQSGGVLAFDELSPNAAVDVGAIVRGAAAAMRIAP